MANEDLRDKSGRLSIDLVAKLFGLEPIELGQIIGRYSEAALSKTPDAPSLQESLQLFSDIALLRDENFDTADFRKWLNSPNVHMKGRSPIALIREGHVRDVAGFVHGIVTGQPS